MGCCSDISSWMLAVAVFSAFLAAFAALGICAYCLRKCLTAGRCLSEARMDGKTVVITGANTGIGKETALDLARRGARVILACRSVERATKAAQYIERETNGEVVVGQLDLTSFRSIRAFAAQINSTESRLDVLINNAGLMCDKSTTVDGIDTQFCTNHFGHFLLTYLLLDKLKMSAPSRIINVSSTAHLGGKMHWDDLNMDKPGSYSSGIMYCQTKLANILFTKELARRLEGTGVNTYSLHPGAVITDFQSNMSQKGIPSIFVSIVNCSIRCMPCLWKTAVQGAQTTIFCAVSEEVEHQSGLYYSDCAVKKPSSRALDQAAAKKLWDVSLTIVGLEEKDS